MSQKIKIALSFGVPESNLLFPLLASGAEHILFWTYFIIFCVTNTFCFDGLVQECIISSSLAIQSCTDPLACYVKRYCVMVQAIIPTLQFRE